MLVRNRQKDLVAVAAILACVAIAPAGCQRSEQERTGQNVQSDRPGDHGSTDRLERDGDNASDHPRMTIYAVNYPLAYFAERIVGDRAEVVFPAPPDVDPAYWSPDEPTVERMFAADLVLLNGADYAKWLAKVPLPEEKLVNTSQSFVNRYLVDEQTHTHGGHHSHGHTHGHDHAHAHTHTVTDFNTWLDPVQAISQAETIAKALEERMPEHAEGLRAGLESLRNDLDQLDQKLETLTQQGSNVRLIASHPVYDYLARRYGWNLRSVHWEPGEMPSEEQWEEFGELLQSHPTQWMLWEDTPDEKIAERLIELDVRPVVFLPCGNVPKEGDYVEVMQANVERLRPVFQ